MLYSFLFLVNKYIGFNLFEKLLNLYEDRYIKKYISKKMIGAQEIPTINSSELTQEIFEQLSDNYRRPVLIKGYLKETNAVKSWTENYLKETIDDDFKLTILEKEDKLILKDYTFKEFCENMNSSNIYINNNNTIFSNYPQLFNDIKDRFYDLINTLKNSSLRNIHIANLFIGYNSSDKMKGSNTHCGGSGNFFCMIKGSKKWTLVDPKYSIFLKGRVSQSGIHAQTLFDMPDTDISVEPDILHHLPRYEVVLEHGDILWNAPWWWHRIQNMNDGLNIGLAIRNNKVTKLNLLNNFTYTISGYTYLFYNTYLIRLYERIMMNKEEHFGKSDNKNNVLEQINKLNQRHPKTYELKLTKDKDQ